MKPLSGNRILVCGKGGSGKSSVVSLMALILEGKGYDVILVDGDASNPGGLARLAMGVTEGPRALFDFFGGREEVTCPVDDPGPLTRRRESTAVTVSPIQLEEIPAEYYRRDGNLTLFRVGKIHAANEGCDGPMSKVTRDFVVTGNHVMLIDVEAGIEHFGRGVEQHVDTVLVVVDPTYESLEIAERVAEISTQMGVGNVWALLNSVQSRTSEIETRIELKKRGVNVIGSLDYDPDVKRAGFEGTAIELCAAQEQMYHLVDDLEKAIEADDRGSSHERNWYENLVMS
jgi:CO dehydrogenase maturation factor